MSSMSNAAYQAYLNQLQYCGRDKLPSLDDLKVFSYRSFELFSKEVIAIKASPQNLSTFPKPWMFSEIFVYSDDIEGIHIRCDRVSRGGVRWSSRLDYRNEALDLASTQRLKNTCITAGGSKGCFVIKSNIDVKQAYQIYVEGLLSVIDKDPSLGDDFYLALGPDKGTADCSDLANAISADRGFWFGDALATGGSSGYNHKDLGVTAKTTWLSLLQHSFKEIFYFDAYEIYRNNFSDRSFYQKRPRDIKIIGIGDMSGDVFGNGMIRTPGTALLIAAFNHTHIFLDPASNQSAYSERYRLFDSQLNWDSYDLSLLSEGSMIVPRPSQGIILTPQVQELLDTELTCVSDIELIELILQTKADILFNGGIGTYVYSSQELSLLDDVSRLRPCISADKLKCLAVGEGGNLGMTPLSRREFCLKGGSAMGDFIDNVGGVICSDYEVNLKLLVLPEYRHMIIQQAKKAAVLHTMRVANSNILSVLVEEKILKNKHDAEASYKELFKILSSSVSFDSSNYEFSTLCKADLSVILAYVKLHLKQLMFPYFETRPFLTDYCLSINIRDYLIDNPTIIKNLQLTYWINTLTAAHGISFFINDPRLISLDYLRTFLQDMSQSFMSDCFKAVSSGEQYPDYVRANVPIAEQDRYLAYEPYLCYFNYNFKDFPRNFSYVEI